MVGGAGGTDAETKGAGAGAPQYAQLQGAGPLVEYQQPAGPWLASESEDVRHEEWPATDRHKGWPHSRGDAPIGARPRTQCALTPGTGVAEIEEAWTQLGADSDGGPCPRSATRPSLLASLG